jgi:hypothetical protein
MGNANSQMLESIVQGSNCTTFVPSTVKTDNSVVDHEEVERLRKRFMKLDKARSLFRSYPI